MDDETLMAKEIVNNLKPLDIRVNVAMYEGSRSHLCVDVALFINDEEIFECVSRESVEQLLHTSLKDSEYSKEEQKQIKEYVWQAIDELLDEPYDKDFNYKIERG